MQFGVSKRAFQRSGNFALLYLLTLFVLQYAIGGRNDAHFPTNLGFACSLLPSIAEVCRRVDINRQQFNKYLAGSVRPSRHNMRRICDFFGVTESELLMDPHALPVSSHCANR
ncbi:helix-turn-helix transcriptional regulator [Salipiger sp. 1_MG-2023]|uniref:helix-turn-helix domain-containing protein n=1 Tax=Salipiger sp. 1_MG-2023 TaxID=3062665 RepID=UPI0026E1E9F1|nr:helix-turn-helix transcriptional regulator [Salipiger sp. 1_MG-2023]MDO6588357.1 helix-turn-helix transcriptional regulator [Salipiger sp. 1_MG-2023]